jgi:hypothetical protein
MKKMIIIKLGLPLWLVEVLNKGRFKQRKIIEEKKYFEISPNRVLKHEINGGMTNEIQGHRVLRRYKEKLFFFDGKVNIMIFGRKQK